MKVRPNRVGEEIKKELVLLIRNGIKDPRVDSLISITDVEDEKLLNAVYDIFKEKYKDVLTFEE